MIVTDSSPLIALGRIGHLSLLPKVLGNIIAPEAVIREIGSRPYWLDERVVENRPLVRALRGRLDAGESEVIALAIEVSASAALLDERRARRVATEFGVPVLGTVGMLLRAKRQGLLQAVQPVLDALDEADFRLAPRLRAEALRRAGE
ncbi:MAG: DUF3368 domain-containing protein [Bacteroidota bacterium]